MTPFNFLSSVLFNLKRVQGSFSHVNDPYQRVIGAHFYELKHVHNSCSLELRELASLTLDSWGKTRLGKSRCENLHEKSARLCFFLNKNKIYVHITLLKFTTTEHDIVTAFEAFNVVTNTCHAAVAQ